MDLVGDDRAQSIQIGAVLLFAVLIIAFSSYQAFVVPQQNREVEFSHSQTVQSQMQDLRNAIVSASDSTGSRAVSVQLGTQYPSRAIARNPGPPSGSLRTVGTTDDGVDLTIANAQASGETGDFWNNSQSYTTGAISYQPQYNVYTNPPETVYDSTVLYNSFRSGNVTVANQSFIDGNDISLVVVNGSLSRSSTGSTSVDVRPVSASSQTVQLEDSGSNIEITFSSQRSASYWGFLVNTQSTVTDVTGPSTTDSNGFYDVTVTLESGRTYNLQMTEIGVGTRVSDEDTAYLTDTDGDGTTLSQGETTELTLEVRDRYNNPPDNASETTVNAQVAGSGSLDSTSQTPNEDGEVTFEYTAPSSSTGTQDIEFTYGGLSDGTFAESTPQDVVMTVDVESSSGGSGGSGAGNGGTSTYSTTDDTVTVSGENGLWTGVTYTDQLRFSNANPVLTSDNYDRIQTSATFRNDTHNYSIEVTIEQRPNGQFQTRSVDISENTPTASNTYDEQLTPDAARLVFNDSVYTGLNVLEPSNYNSPDSNLKRVLYDISTLDGSDVDVQFSNVDGRTDATLWDRTLIVAAQPDPAAGDDVEFVAINFTTAVDTTGWTLTDGSGDTTSLPSETVDGTIYLANDPTAFTNEYGTVDSSQVYQLDTTLADSGEALELIDADGDMRDELAYSDDSNDSPQTSRDWTRNDVTTGDITDRTLDEYFYTDTNTEGDWGLTTPATYFGSGGFQSSDAASLIPSTTQQNQSVTFSPATSEISPGTQLTFNFDDPQQVGPRQVDYQGSSVGANFATSDTNTVTQTETGFEFTVTTDETIATTDTARVWVSSVNTGLDTDQNNPYDVTITRGDTSETTGTTFDVSGSSGDAELSGLAVSDLAESTTGQEQTVEFTLDSPLPRGDSLMISLYDPESSGEVDYQNNGGITDVPSDIGTIEFSTQNTDNSTIRVTDTNGDIPAGTYSFTITGVETGTMTNEPYSVNFSRGDADTASTTFGTSQAQNTNLVAGTGTSGGSGNSVLEFDLENTGSSQVTITDISVDSTTTSATAVDTEDSSNEFEGGGGSLDQRIDIGGTTEPLDSEATISPNGGIETFTLGEFRDGPGNGGRVGLNNGDDVIITLTFGDGSTQQYTITV